MIIKFSSKSTHIVKCFFVLIFFTFLPSCTVNMSQNIYRLYFPCMPHPSFRILMFHAVRRNLPVFKRFYGPLNRGLTGTLTTQEFWLFLMYTFFPPNFFIVLIKTRIERKLSICLGLLSLGYYHLQIFLLFSFSAPTMFDSSDAKIWKGLQDVPPYCPQSGARYHRCTTEW